MSNEADKIYQAGYDEGLMHGREAKEAGALTDAEMLRIFVEKVPTSWFKPELHSAILDGLHAVLKAVQGVLSQGEPHAGRVQYGGLEAFPPTAGKGYEHAAPPQAGAKEAPKGDDGLPILARRIYGDEPFGEAS